MIGWHRLFGLGLTDYFTDSCYQVELEKDLSIKQQLLDILVIKQVAGREISEPADGLENLTRYNLMTYKSLRQPLDAWALDELIGHYVNYRKQISSSFQALLPVEEFGLYAVATRHPDKLEGEVSLDLIQKGIYEAKWGSQRIRIIVLSEVPRIERNAIWNMYSGIPENVQFGASHYSWRQIDLSRVTHQLLKYYQVEIIAMPYTVEDFKRDFKEEILSELTSEELLKRLSAEERLKGLPPEEILRSLTREQIEDYLKKLSTSN